MTLLIVSFLIRTSSVQSLFGSSPKLFAAYYVLHQYLTSRHPLCALE